MALPEIKIEENTNQSGSHFTLMAGIGRGMYGVGEIDLAASFPIPATLRQIARALMEQAKKMEREMTLKTDA